jgi:predicted TIM-barrel fold metal-dependent hydrolase
MQLIDCDVHPTVPGLPTLVPYLDDYWSDFVRSRGLQAFDLSTYRPTLPITARADWRAEGGRAALTVEAIGQQLLDPFGIDVAICNVVHGGSSVFNSYFGAAICRATNDWLIENFLDRDARLRASIVVPVQEPDLAAEEIERRAGDARFVQVLMPVSGDMPFGRRFYWPIYRAAAKHGLPVALHPGGGSRYPQSQVGWHSLYIEDYANQAVILQNQMLSLIYDGVFNEFPGLKVVILESGVTWLPAFLTDANNKWMALRREVPWVKEAPFDIARAHFRFSTQPFDAPGDGAVVNRLIDMLGSEEVLLFSTDYPHWQFDGNAAPYPAGLSDERRERLASRNPRATYPRLEGAVQ